MKKIIKIKVLVMDNEIDTPSYGIDVPDRVLINSNKSGVSTMNGHTVIVIDLAKHDISQGAHGGTPLDARRTASRV